MPERSSAEQPPQTPRVHTDHLDKIEIRESAHEEDSRTISESVKRQNRKETGHAVALPPERMSDRMKASAERAAVELVDRLNKGEEVRLRTLLQEFKSPEPRRNRGPEVSEAGMRMLRDKIMETRATYETLGKKDAVSTIDEILVDLDISLKANNSDIEPL